MSMILCEECGHEISDRAKRCPHCGCPVKKTTHTSKIALILIPIAIVAIIAGALWFAVYNNFLFFSKDDKMEYLFNTAVYSGPQEPAIEAYNYFNENYAGTKDEDRAIEILKSVFNDNDLNSFFPFPLGDNLAMLALHMDTKSETVKTLQSFAEILSKAVSVDEINNNPGKYMGKIICIDGTLDHVASDRGSIYLGTYGCNFECFYDKSVLYEGFPWKENLELNRDRVFAVGYVQKYTNDSTGYMVMLDSICLSQFETNWECIEYIAANADNINTILSYS